MDKEFLKKFISEIPFFELLSPEQVEMVADAYVPKEFKKDDTVVTQGENGNGMYVIMFGNADVYVDDKKVATLGNNDFFGEIALIAPEPRTATVKVSSDTMSTFFLSKEAFDDIKIDLNDEVKKEILRRIEENHKLHLEKLKDALF